MRLINNKRINLLFTIIQYRFLKIEIKLRHLIELLESSLQYELFIT